MVDSMEKRDGQAPGAGGVAGGDDVGQFDAIAEHCQRLRSELDRVIVGQDEIVSRLMVAVLTQGHVLIVGVPGLAKTLLVRTLAAATSLSFRRIQFTPDLMPSDVIGTELIQEDPESGRRSVQFSNGPIFANLILADEINRTPPRTQSALLEAMAERQVTVAGRTLPLEAPFVVVATQNPIEQEGTYPLPEAQLDRFMFSLWMGYPDKDDEKRIVAETPRIASQQVEQALDQNTLVRSASLIERMPVSDHVVDYAVSLARATRPDDPQAPAVTREYVEWGAGPRAGQYLVLGAKATAAIAGRPTPSCDDVRAVAMPVLRHRILTNYAATGEDITPKQIVEGVIEAVVEGTSA